MEFLSDYPYLIGNLAFLPVLVVGFVLAGSERRRMLISGLCAVPLALTGFVPPREAGWYWTPQRLGGFAVGLEDGLFLFSSGAMIWLFASIRQRLETGANPSQAAMRYFWMWVLGSAAVFGMHAWGMDFTITCLLVPFGVLVGLFFRNRSLWKLACFGSLGFLILYTGWLRIWLWSFPAFLGPENASGVLATSVLGVPVGEMVWALIFGAAHPLGMAYLLDVTYRPRPRHSEETQDSIG